MKDHHTQKIEKILRNAPTPHPPQDLLPDLLRDAKRVAEPPRTQPGIISPNFWGQWIPRLGFTLVFVLAAVFITAQSNRYPSLEGATRALRELENKRGSLKDAIGKRSQQKGRLEYLRQLKQQRTEIIQLREEKENLLALVAETNRLTVENNRLQEELNRYGDRGMDLTHDVLGEARERARRVQCINNLKQIGLAYRIAMSEQIRTETLIDLIPYIGGSDRPLQCPSDPNHDPKNHENVGPENHTYLWKLGSPELADSRTVITQCPIHQNIGLYDGSVLSGSVFLDGGVELIAEGGNLKLER